MTGNKNLIASVGAILSLGLVTSGLLTLPTVEGEKLHVIFSLIWFALVSLVSISFLLQAFRRDLGTRHNVKYKNDKNDKKGKIAKLSKAYRRVEDGKRLRQYDS